MAGAFGVGSQPATGGAFDSGGEWDHQKQGNGHGAGVLPPSERGGRRGFDVLYAEEHKNSRQGEQGGDGIEHRLRTPDGGSAKGKPGAKACAE